MIDMTEIIAAPGTGVLSDWLEFIEQLHSKPIDLGLERMNLMIDKLGIRFSCPVFTVAGTNGKGSTCAMLESVLRCAGYRVGMHTSPHLVRFNERVFLDGKEADDETIVRALKAVNEARGDLTLSYFEFTGLAILKIFAEAHLDAVILEIGLGGRLDAMNAIDTDCGIVCAIGIDHIAFLGSTREQIAYEKACIYRAGRPAVCTDRNPPQTLLDHAARIGAPLYVYGRDFETQISSDGKFFDLRVAGIDERLEGLPLPALAGANQIQNAAGALAALMLMRANFPRYRSGIARGLESVRLTGRFQCIKPRDELGAELTIDVGHNPNAAEALLRNLKGYRAGGEELWAVFGMLSDKDMKEVSRIVSPVVSRWFVASLTGPRAASSSELCRAMKQAGVDMSRVGAFDCVADALGQALAESRKAMRDGRAVKIIGFGSFVTVSAIMQALGGKVPLGVYP